MQDNWQKYLPRSTFSQDLVLKYIVEIHLIGEHYFEVKEDGAPLIASCHQIVNRGVHVKTR